MATPTPALPPPPGVTSNFKNPPTLIRQNDIAMGISIPLVTIFFGLRSYARIVIKRTWITEDCKYLPLVISVLTMVGVALLAYVSCILWFWYYLTVSRLALCHSLGLGPGRWTTVAADTSGISRQRKPIKLYMWVTHTVSDEADFSVVQHLLNPLRHRDLHNQAGHSLALPPCILPSSLGSFRHQHHRSHRHTYPVLWNHDLLQDI